MQGLLGAASLSYRVNQILQDAQNESSVVALSSTTLNTLSRLVYGLTKTSTMPTADAVMNNLHDMSQTFINMITSENSYRKLFDIDWLRGDEVRSEPFFERHMPNGSNDNEEANLNL